MGTVFMNLSWNLYDSELRLSGDEAPSCPKNRRDDDNYQISGECQDTKRLTIGILCTTHASVTRAGWSAKLAYEN